MALLEFLAGPPIPEFLLIFAPILVLRTGAYFLWLLFDQNRSVFGLPVEFMDIKPDGYWVPSLIVASIQAIWIGFLIIANLALGGAIFHRLI